MENIKIHILHCGQVKVDIGTPFKQKTLNPVAYAGICRSKKYQVILPVSAYLIEHPKGLVLVDTGWHTAMRGSKSDLIKQTGHIHYKASKAILPKGQAISEQLSVLGIKQEDIKYIVLSHLDTDHVSGLKLVERAQNILASPYEWSSANKLGLRYKPQMWKGINIGTIQFQNSGIGPQGLSFDLFGDGRIELIHAPGHSKGGIVTKIENNGKYVLLTGDCGYATKSWKEMILPGLYYNKKIMVNSLLWVQQMAASPNCVKALATHDPNIEPHIIEL